MIARILSVLPTDTPITIERRLREVAPTLARSVIVAIGAEVWRRFITTMASERKSAIDAMDELRGGPPDRVPGIGPSTTARLTDAQLDEADENVGVDQWDYAPISEAEIVAAFAVAA